MLAVIDDQHQDLLHCFRNSNILSILLISWSTSIKKFIDYLHWGKICIGNGGINGFLFFPFNLPDLKTMAWFPSIVQKWPTSFVLFCKDYYEYILRSYIHIWILCEFIYSYYVHIFIYEYMNIYYVHILWTYMNILLFMNIFEEFQIIEHIILLDIFEQLENLRQWCLWWLSNFLTCFKLNLHISCSRYGINHFSKKFWFLKCKMGFGYHSLGRVLTDACLGLFVLISCF